jgi:hypothetical protein
MQQRCRRLQPWEKRRLYQLSGSRLPGRRQRAQNTTIFGAALWRSHCSCELQGVRMRTSGPRVRRLLGPVISALMAACGHSASPSPQPCTYGVTASPTSFQAAGGTGSATVSTGATCAWTAKADAGWLSISSGGSGTGNGIVAFTVAPNGDTTVRTGTLTIAGQTVSVREDAAVIPCTYAVSPATATLGKDGGTGTFGVTAGAGCSWTAESSAPWLAVTAGQGTGSGSVTYSVPRNMQTAGRSGTIRVADQVFTLTQAGDVGGCQYSVVPIQFSPCMASVELTTQITTQTECPWTAAPGAAWISLISGQSGSGSGTVRFRVSDNYDPPRSGIVMIRWPTPTEGQNLQIAQAGCHYAVSLTTFGFSAAGGTGRFDVLQQSDPNTCGGATQDRCLWTARSDVAWITVTTSMPQTGDNPVSFTVAANESATPRAGTIAVRDKIVRIHQSGR